MQTPATLIQWAGLVQLAEAHGIGFTIVEHLSAPYRINPDTRIIYLDGRLDLGTDGFAALSAALTQLTYHNVDMLYRAPIPEQLTRLGTPGR